MGSTPLFYFWLTFIKLISTFSSQLHKSTMKAPKPVVRKGRRVAKKIEKENEMSEQEEDSGTVKVCDLGTCT